jgi:ABC-type transport system involved in multi-copper enzyme maturation permease subunit
MIWNIIVKEFRSNIVTPGFIVGLLLCLTLIPYTVYRGIQTYQTRLAQYEVDAKAAVDVYDAPSYWSVKPILVKPVSPLSVFSAGIVEPTGSKVQLDRTEKPVISSDIVSLNENPFMSRSMSLDFAMALSILLSLLGILFSYDMLSREKEQGTLKLALSNPVSRSAFFIGKIAGIFLTLLPILIICFLVILLILQFSPAVRFSAADYGRIVILLVLSLVYFGFFVFLGGFISSRTKSSTSSIIINLLTWCVLLFLLPNVADYLGKNITPTGDYKQMKFNTAEIDNQWWKVQRPEIDSIVSKDFPGIQRNLFLCVAGDIDGFYLAYFSPKSTMEYERRVKELSYPVLLENCDRKWPIQSAYLQQVYRQERTVRYLSCLSPAGIFRYIAASLCRTGADSEVQFMNQARQFQDMFFGYIMQNRLFSKYEYFTSDDPGKFSDDEDDCRKRATEFFEKHTGMSMRDFYQVFDRVDTSGFPRFAYAEPTLGNDLYAQLYLVAGILIACILLFWLSYMSFIKYDVR